VRGKKAEKAAVRLGQGNGQACVQMLITIESIRILYNLGDRGGLGASARATGKDDEHERSGLCLVVTANTMSSASYSTVRARRANHDNLRMCHAATTYRS
jgi:hypothetical protein